MAKSSKKDAIPETPETTQEEKTDGVHEAEPQETASVAVEPVVEGLPEKISVDRKLFNKLAYACIQTRTSGVVGQAGLMHFGRMIAGPGCTYTQALDIWAEIRKQFDEGL